MRKPSALCLRCVISRLISDIDFYAAGNRGLISIALNKAFADWGEVFPNAACVVSLVHRLMHRAEVVRIEGDSYRAKEAQERLAARAKQRSGKLGKGKP